MAEILQGIRNDLPFLIQSLFLTAAALTVLLCVVHLAIIVFYCLPVVRVSR